MHGSGDHLGEHPTDIMEFAFELTITNSLAEGRFDRGSN